MRIPIVFSGLMVAIIWTRRRKRFEPLFDVGDQSIFEVVDIDGRGNMHGGDKAKPVANAAFLDDLFQLRRNQHDLPLLSGVKKQIFRLRLHRSGCACHHDFLCAVGDDIMVSSMPQSEDSTHLSPEDKYYDAIDRVAEGDLAGAVIAFRSCLVDDPSMLDAMHGLIRALQDLGELDEAIGIAIRLSYLAPEDVLAHTSLSILYQHKGMVPEAEAEAMKAKLLSWKLELRQQKLNPGTS